MEQCHGVGGTVAPMAQTAPFCLPHRAPGSGKVPYLVFILHSGLNTLLSSLALFPASGSTTQYCPAIPCFKQQACLNKKPGCEPAASSLEKGMQTLANI